MFALVHRRSSITESEHQRECKVNEEFASSYQWKTVLPSFKLEADTESFHSVELPQDLPDYKFDLLRLDLQPCGELSKVIVYGETLDGCQLIWKMQQTQDPSLQFDFADVTRGGWVIYANAAESSANFLLSPYPFGGTGDANFCRRFCWITPWRENAATFDVESYQSPDFSFKNCDYAIIKLAARCVISKVQVSTWGVAGDLPHSIDLLAADVPDLATLTIPQQREYFERYISNAALVHLGSISWKELVSDEEYQLAFRPATLTHVFVCMTPNGALCGVKVLGRLL